MVLFRWTVGINTIPLQLFALMLSFAFATLSYRFVELPLRTSGRVRQMPNSRVVVIGLSLVAFASGSAALMFYNEKNLSLSVTADADTWLPTSPIKEVRVAAECKLVSKSQALAGGTLQTYKLSDCSDLVRPVGRLIVAGDSHAWAYTAMLMDYAKRTARDVFVLTKGGCAFLDLKRPMTAADDECKIYTHAAKAEIKNLMRPGDILFLPSLRVSRFRDQWGGAPDKTAVNAETSARLAATLEAIDYLQPLSRNGLSVVVEAPKPVFKSPPFRCSDWFNEKNPICSFGFTVARDEMIEIRAEAMSSILTVVNKLDGATVWDPLVTLCPTDVCSAFLNEKPMYFDGDHLSGFGNVILLKSFINHIGIYYGN